MAVSAYRSGQAWAYLVALVWACWLLSESVWVSRQERAMETVWGHYHRQCHEQYCRHRVNQARSLHHNPLWLDNTGYCRKSHHGMVRTAAAHLPDRTAEDWQNPCVPCSAFAGTH